MDHFNGDIARTPEDFAQCLELVTRLAPDTYVPPFGEPGNKTYILRVGEDRRRIIGLIHMEWAPEVRHMLVEPGYKAKQFAYSVLHRATEMNLRETGHKRYYFTVPLDQSDAIERYVKDGAAIIDVNHARFLRTL